ncbi:beta-galactosidase [Treponema succinifaciens]|uniref:beta-galactosidase n=1 Tax=Treponema succinifaciens TaxID=167 RepID=UPI003FCCE3C6
MISYSFDNKSLFKGEKRWFPIMGEIHYSRYPDSGWKEALLKMKEGGVDIVSSYVIWIHHEEIENQFEWTGWRDLRKFVQTIKECGLSMILRIGPWSHAEVRHGGFPDWLLAKCPDARNTNDEKYFAEVEKFYKAIYEQVKGLLLKDGGPIIGVQIENEFGHCGGLTGDAGEAHMKRLEKMARETGFDVPLYTATGWGGAVTAGLLPVMGGYCEAPWDPRITEIEPSGNYVFTYERNDHAIGCDFGLGEGITFDMTKYPYLTAELGGGLQVTLKRRPIAQPKDIGAMSLAKMGSGCNLLGYYMYHGGQNPEGKLTTLEENIATGSLNDMSIKNYDFRAPLGEYGLPNGTYGEIKLYSLFVHDFGEFLASTETDLPDSNPITPENFSDLRTSWRYKECEKCGKKRGFVFVNNYQRRRKMAGHKNVVLASTEKSGADIQFPAIDVADKDFFFLPFNMKVADGLLKTSLATPLCVLNNQRKVYVFYSAAKPVGSLAEKDSSVCSAKDASVSLYQFEGEVPDCDIVTLSREDALNAHKVSANGKEYLVVTDSVLFQNNQDGKTELEFEDCKKISFKAFPELEKVPEGFSAKKCVCGFTVYTFDQDTAESPKVSCQKISEDEKTAVYKISVESWQNGLDDLFIDIGYAGNCARLYENGKLIDDGIFVGENYPWSIGLKRYGKNAHDFTLEIDALKKDAPIFIEEWPDFAGQGSLKKVNGIKARAFVKISAQL